MIEHVTSFPYYEQGVPAVKNTGSQRARGISSPAKWMNLIGLQDATGSHAVNRSDLLAFVVLFGAALLLYLPGIGWGVPHATAPDRVFAWGSDELAPLGSLAEPYRAIFDRSGPFNPQYPLFHYFVQALFQVPYLAWLFLSGSAERISTTYPFGFADPVGALAVLTILGRLPSSLMGAATVAVTYDVARVMWDRRTGLLAALLVLPTYTMVYYSRTSNVDMASLFWTSVGLAITARAFQSGLTSRRAAALGAAAALATATKDASAFAFLGVAITLVPWQVRRETRRGTPATGIWSPLLVGLVVAAVGYAFASGMLLYPAQFRGHVAWVTGTVAAFVYPDTAAGLLSLVRECAAHIVSSVGAPTAILGVLGLGIAVRRSRGSLWLAMLAPAIIVGTVLPIHFVNFRYVLIPAYALTFFAAFAVSYVCGSGEGRARFVASAVLLVAVTWSLVRALDLTYQMRNDSRYAVAAWLASHARPGDVIAYFGAVQKLPALERGIETVGHEALCSRAEWASVRPDFVLLIPQQHFETAHSWTLPPYIYDALRDGSLGYGRVGWFQTRGLSSRRPVPFVNPPVQVFVRTEDAPTVEAGPPKPAILASLEAALWLSPGPPAGLRRSASDRSFDPCRSVAW